MERADNPDTRRQATQEATVRRLREWFELLIDLPTEHRAAWIADNVSEPDARLKLARMLERAAGADGFLDVPATEHARALYGDDASTTSMLGRRVGVFRLVRLLGEGGMASVFLGVREGGDFDQSVAIKILRRGLYSEVEQRLFQRERQVLASLSHPNVARLIDGGLTDAGVPFLVMEYVDGEPITHFAKTHALDTRARLLLFLTVCRTVEAAHRALIVHRDIKPANILVAADGAVKLLDFGIAKLLEENVELGTVGIFTPDYAAPEQIAAQPVTTATDVYSLGVLLHELLTGVRPGRAGVVRRPSSMAVDRAKASPETALGAERVRKLLRGDLDTVMLKALAAEPEQRYPSAGALADDIERHLQGHPVMAHAPSTWYRAKKFVTRHKGGVLVTVAVTLAMLSTVAVALWQAGVARREAQLATQQEQVAREQAERADAVQGFLVSIFEANTSYQTDPVKARQTTAQQLLELGAKKIDTAMMDAPDAKVSMLNVLSKLYTELDLYDQAAALSRKSIDVVHATHGAFGIEAFEAQMNLASSLHSSSSDEQARQVLQDAQDTLDRNHDTDPKRRGSLYIKLAEYYTMRDTALTLDYARKAVDLYEPLGNSNVLGDALTHRARAEHQNDLDDAAIASYQGAIDVERKVNGDSSPDLPIYYAELAEIQMLHHQIPAGLDSARKALQTARTVQGDDQLDVIQCEMRLGRFLADSGQIAEGTALVTSAKRKAFALRGPDDGFLVPSILYSSAYLSFRSGRLEDAVEDLDIAINNRRRARPGTLPLAQFLELAALLETERDEFDLAKRNIDESAAIRAHAGQKVPTPQLDANVTARIRLAIAQHQYAQALEFSKLLSSNASNVDPLDRQTLYDELLVAEARLANGDADGAIELSRNVRETIEKGGLATFYGVLTSRADFIEGSAEVRKRDAQAALPLLKRALDWRLRTLDAASIEIAQAEKMLAEGFALEGHPSDAKKLQAAAAVVELQNKQLRLQRRESLAPLKMQAR